MGSYIDIVKMYKEYLSQIRDNLEDYFLYYDSTILILRSETPNVEDNYYPIIDWYYSSERQRYIGDRIKFKVNEEHKTKFLLDEPDLVEITVKEFEDELNKMIKIYSKK